MSGETDIIFGGGPGGDDEPELITPGGDPGNLFGTAPVANDDLFTFSAADYVYGYMVDTTTGENWYGYFYLGNVFNNNGSGRDYDPEGNYFAVYLVDGSSQLISPVDLGDDHTIWMSSYGGFGYTGDFRHLAEGEVFTDSFTYRITDGGGSDSATVTIRITGVNDAPTAGTINLTADADTPLVVDLTSYVHDLDDGATISLVGLAPQLSSILDPGLFSVSGDVLTFDAAGTLDWLADGLSIQKWFTFTFQDEHGATGQATVKFRVYGTNQAPEGVDDTFHISADPSDLTYRGVDYAILDVLANDIDPDRRAFSPDSLREELHIVDVDASGLRGAILWDYEIVVYDPGAAFVSLAAGQTATETFTYVLADLAGVESTATVTMVIEGVNDGPVAEDDVYTVGADAGPTFLPNLSNDHDPDDGDVFVYAGTSGASGIAGLGPNGAFFDPGQHYAYLGEGQTVTLTWSYSIVDAGGLTDDATVSLTVVGVNDGPVAGADAYTIGEDDGALALDVLANDADVDVGDALSIFSVDASGALGSVAIAEGGTALVYDAGDAFQSLGAGATATETIVYTVADGHGGTDVATATITVIGANDGPDAAADAFAAGEDDGPTLLDALANDTDVDLGDVLRIVSVDGSGALGLVSVSADGTSLVYDPNGAFEALGLGETATETFDYVISDGQGGEATATVTVTIAGVNEAVTAPAGGGPLVGSDYADDLFVGDGRKPVAEGGGGDDRFFLGAGDDRAYGGDGDDVFFMASGNDRVEGGEGIDTAVFDANFGDCTLVVLGKGRGAEADLKIWDGHDNSTLSGIEFVAFADGMLEVATMTFTAGDLYA